MKLRVFSLTVAMLLAITAVTLYIFKAAPASDHQDSPLTVSRPGADITDVFIFPASNPENVVLAMDVHPLVPAGMSQNVRFDPAVLYQFKIDTTGDYREDKVLQFRPVGAGASQRLEFSGVVSAQAGTESSWAGGDHLIPVGKAMNVGDGIEIYAGARREPFYFDLSQFFKLIPDRNYKNQPSPPAPTASCFRKPGVDFFRNYDVLSIVAEVPRALLAGPGGRLGVVHLYATTSLSSGSNGRYMQVERLGRPGVKELFEAFKNHDVSNRATPWNDPTLANSISSFMTASKPAGAGRSAELANAVKHVLMPDELTADLSAPGPAAYLAVETKGKSALPTAVVRVVPDAGLKGLKKSIANKSRDFGGRDPSSPVIDISLGVVYGTLGQKVGLAHDDDKATSCLTSDNVTAGTRGVTTTFPYLGQQI